MPISKTVQFITMVRQATQAQQVEKSDYNHSLYCPACHKYTFHRVEEHGDWEHYFCKCGNQQSYRVR